MTLLGAMMLTKALRLLRFHRRDKHSKGIKSCQAESRLSQEKDGQRVSELMIFEFEFRLPKRWYLLPASKTALAAERNQYISHR